MANHQGGAMTINHLYIQTPTLENAEINARSDKRVFLKMECFQPVGSFKARGIGVLCKAAVDAGKSRLISSSGGNAGYAAAYAGRQLGIPVTVVVPESTSPRAKERIAAEGAEVIIHGKVWDDADTYARQLVATTGAAYIHPFDDPLIWQGHATIITEAAQQSPKPDAVLVCVGGGGLLCGLVEGMHAVGWQDVPVIAVETHGADSFYQSVASNTLVRLPGITSIAKTLGAAQVAAQTLVWQQQHPIIPVRVSDAAAVNACLRFAEDMRVIVEPACGATLSLVYDQSPLLSEYQSLLVIVCGGAGTTYEQLQSWQQTL
jgi:L-serine/L-threonine ammonia-lyase